MFEPTEYLKDNYLLGPVEFFKAGGYLARVEKQAIKKYQDTCRKLAIGEKCEAQKWAKEVVDDKFLVNLWYQVLIVMVFMFVICYSNNNNNNLDIGYSRST